MINNISSSDFNLLPGDLIELYFFDEKVEYRFEISKRVVPNYEECIIINLPFSRLNDFYKGEDFVQCRCVHKNVVYEFTGEIVKIIKDDMPCVILKPSKKFTEFNQRKKSRISVDIVAEYKVLSGMPGLDNSMNRGFIMIKDASLEGISFQTTANIPINAIIEIDLFKEGITLNAHVMKVQIVNEKNFYGGKIINLDDNNKTKLQRLLEKTLNADKMERIY